MTQIYTSLYLKRFYPLSFRRNNGQNNIIIPPFPETNTIHPGKPLPRPVDFALMRKDPAPLRVPARDLKHDLPPFLNHHIRRPDLDIYVVDGVCEDWLDVCGEVLAVR